MQTDGSAPEGRVTEPGATKDGFFRQVSGGGDRLPVIAIDSDRDHTCVNPRDGVARVPESVHVRLVSGCFMTSMVGCPGDEPFLRLLEGRVPVSERERLFEHVHVCSRCSLLLATPEAVSSRPRWSNGGAGGGVLVAS